MTKRNMLLSLASGKLGDMVFYRAGGEQRTRTRVTPRNPKSISQMENRIPMANLSALYKGWAPILRQSLSTKSAKESAFNAFVRENKPANNFYVPKEFTENGQGVPFGMVLSTGTSDLVLQPRIVTHRGAEKGTPAKFYMNIDCLLDATKADASTDSGTDIAKSFHNEEAVKALRDMLPSYVPSKYTLVVMTGAYTEVNTEFNGKEVLGQVFKPTYGVLSVDGSNWKYDTYGCDKSELPLTISIFGDFGEDVGTDRDKNEVLKASHAAWGTGYVTVDDALSEGIAIILAYEVDGKLVVSNSRFVASQYLTEYGSRRKIKNYFSLGAAFYVQAMQEYGYSAPSALSSQSLAADPAEESNPDEEEEEEEEP